LTHFEPLVFYINGKPYLRSFTLFDKVLIDSGHVLYSILPRETVSTYALRRRWHNREL